MRTLLRWVAPVLAACAALTSAPALAQTTMVSDPAGDGLQGDRLDITSVTVANRDHAIVTTVSMVRVGHGQLAVWIQAHGDRLRSAVVVATSHRLHGDKTQLLNADGVVECPGLRVSWDESADQVNARVPSRCLDGGNYGGVRVRTITEIHGGEDVDLGPNGPRGNWRWTSWTSRG
jgi:hypothetical protein